MSKRVKLQKLSRARSRIRQALTCGRPRVAGPREPSGRLKPPGPNEIVVEHRRRLLGRPTASGYALRGAENALDLMLARSWITRALHDAAGDFRRLYLAAFPALPDLRTTRVDEAPGESSLERLSRSVQDPNPDGNPAAMLALRTLWRVLAARPTARDELIEVCLLHHSWPPWLLGMLQTRPLTKPEILARRAFFEGLHLVNQVLARPGLRITA